MRFKTSIDLSGPFFTGDPAKKFQQNVMDLMDVIAEQGEADVAGQMRASQAGRKPMRGMNPPRVSGWVIGRTRALAGKRWRQTAVVSVNNRGLSREDGVRLMAAAAQVERQTGAFRRTAARFRKVRKHVDLLKGIR